MIRNYYELNPFSHRNIYEEIYYSGETSSWIYFSKQNSFLGTYATRGIEFPTGSKCLLYLSSILLEIIFDEKHLFQAPT